MDESLQARFKTLGNFPSPPRIAQDIIALANDPDVGIAEVSTAISRDPALSTKVLRMANSPLYAQRRRSENLRQAMTLMGLDATMTLCLGFSIASNFQSTKASSLDYKQYWKRSVLSGLSARCISEALKLANPEDIFLAGLLQDIGILALDRARPGFYKELPADATHAQYIALERKELGEDHAALGSWLLGSWNMPASMCAAVESSHSADKIRAGADHADVARCVALGGELAGALLSKNMREEVPRFSRRAAQIAGLRADQVGKLVERVNQLMPDMAQMFDTKLLSPDEALQLTEQAQDLLAARSVQSLHEIENLRTTNTELEARSSEFEDASRRDPLTGIFNRRHVDERLREEFAAAITGGWDLAVIFVDLDHFKSINDTYGHPTGDTVLQGTANLLNHVVRSGDIVGRYGGEEFVIVLPGGSRTSALGLGERLVAALRGHKHDANGKPLTVTASIGLAVHSGAMPFSDATDLVNAADKAMYTAKHTGRNRLVMYGEAEPRVAAFGT